MNARDRRRARRRAKALVAGGLGGDALAQSSGRVLRAVPVWTQPGDFHSWFVPVAIDDRLAGYFHLGDDLVLLGYSSFQRHTGSVEGCPPKKSWLNRAVIRRTAATLARPEESLGRPYLNFDVRGSRLAWAVDATSADGGKRTIFVAGDAVYDDSAGRGLG